MTQIFDDVDVNAIFDFSTGYPRLKMFELSSAEQELVASFAEIDQRVSDTGSPSDTQEALVSGVSIVERLDTRRVGWRKFVTFNTGVNVQILGRQQPQSPLLPMVSDWVVETISGNGWGPDGNQSALGNLHSNVMALAAQTGGGVRFDEAQGQFVAGSGDAIRRLLRLN